MRTEGSARGSSSAPAVRGEAWTARPLPGWALGLFVLAAVAATFLPTVRFGFVSWDDPLHVLENPLVVGPRGSLRDALLTPQLGYPSPLSVAMHRLEHGLAPEGARLHHAVNLLLHLGVVALVGGIGLRLTGSRFAAALAALLFGVHPVVAESVSWVSGRKDLLTALFSLSACLLALRDGPVTARRTFGFAALVALGLACKPTAAAALPAALVLRATCGRSLRGSAALLAPSALLVLAHVPLAVRGQEAVHALGPTLSLARHARDVHYALGHHLALALGLVEPCVKYLPEVVPMPFTPRVDLVPLAALTAVALAALLLAPTRRRLVVGALVAAAALYAPNSGLIPLVRFLADTYVYLPLSMLALAVAVVVDAALLRGGPRRHAYEALALVAAAALLAPSAARSSRRFTDSVTLWSHAYAHNDHDARLCTNWCEAVRRNAPPAEHLRVAELCGARHGAARFAKHRGIALVASGRGREGLASLERALAFDPGDAELARAVDRLREALRRRRSASPASAARAP